MSRYDDRNRRRDRTPSPGRDGSRSGRDVNRSRDTESKRGSGSISPARGNGRYKDESSRRERSLSRNGERSPRRGERDRTPQRGRRERTPPRDARARSSSLNGRPGRDRSPLRSERNRKSSPAGRRDRDRSLSRDKRNNNSPQRGGRDRDRTPPRVGRGTRSLSRGRRDSNASLKSVEGRTSRREGRDRSPRGDIRDRSPAGGRGRDRTPTRGVRDRSPKRVGRDRSSSLNGRRDRNRTPPRGTRDRTPSPKGSRGRNRSVVRGERSRDETPSRRGRDVDRSPSRTRSGRGNSKDRDSSLSNRRERKRSRSNSRNSRSPARGNREFKFEDLTSSQLSKWLKEVGLSSRQIEDMERERITARELQKMSEREIAKIIGDTRIVSTILQEIDRPSKDILEAATGGKREERDEDYIGKTVKVDDRGRMEDARVIEIIDKKYWMVKILETGKSVEVRKSDIELPNLGCSRKSVVGMTVTVRDRRGKREATIERENSDGTYEVKFSDGGYDSSVRKDDIDFPHGGNGGDMYDIQLDELEGAKLDVGGGYMGGNPEIRIFCGSQRKELNGRGSDPKFKDVKFSDVDCGKVNEVIFELYSRGMVRTSKVAEAKLPLRDVLDESRGVSESVTFYTNKDEKKGKLHFRISCKTSKSVGGSSREGGIEIGVSRSGVIPLAVYHISGTDLVISEGDLVTYSGDAIVNCCDPECIGKSGLSLDRALNSEGGREFEDDREDLKKDRHGDRCPMGTAVIMSGGKLKAKWVIHAAAPKFSSRSSKRDLKELESLYKDCIARANDERCEDVAFSLLPPVDWHGGMELEDVVEVTLESLKYELERGSSLKEVHLVASSRSELRVIENEAESILKDFRSREGQKKKNDFEAKTSDGKIYLEDFEDMMKKLDISSSEATILFEYHDKEDLGYLVYEDFQDSFPIFKDKPDDLRRIGDSLKDKIDEIIEGYKKFEDKQVEAKWKERKRGLEGWLRATLLHVNSDGTFEVEYDQKDHSGRRLCWEHCPRSKIKLPAEERSKIVVAVKRGSGFPSSRWMRSKAEYTVRIFGDKESTELARTKPQTGSSPDFNEKLTFTCTKGKYRSLRFEVHDKSKMILDGFYDLDDRSRDNARPRTETVKLKTSKSSSGDSGYIEVTVVCSLAFTVREAFKLMGDRNGEVSFRAALRFISDNNLSVDEDQLKDVYDAIDKREGDIITLKEFTAVNPSQTSENKDFVDALLNFEQGAGDGAGREEVKKWSERDVEKWLEKKGWSKYISGFKRVDGFRLLGLTTVDLEDMRVDRRHAHDILSDIEKLSRGGGGSGSDPREWTEKDVAAWVTKQGFSKRDVEKFEDKRIDGRALLKMDQRSLVDTLRLDWRDAKDLIMKLDDLTREGGRSGDSKDRRDDRKEPERRRSDDDRRNDRETRGGGRSSERARETRREPPKPITIVFQFGEKNAHSTREMKCETSETPLDICERIHEKYLKTVGATEMELMFKQKPLHQDKGTIGDLGVKDGDRLVVRRRK